MPLSNYNVCAKASTAFVLLIPVLFAFASYCFLCSSFALIAIISHTCCNLNFLIYFLLYIEDCIKVGAIEVGIVIGT
jgi:hypothetical protein